MNYLANTALAAVLVLGLPASSVGAQTNESSSAKKSSSGDAGAQFDQAGKRLGEGAQHVGEGIKDGAIQVWEAVKAGAQAVGDKFNSKPSHAPASKPATGSSSQ